MNEYTKASFENFKPDGNVFYSAEYEPELQKMILHVIDTEGPVHEDVLIRRISKEHGFNRAGRQIREKVLSLAEHAAGNS